MMFLDCPGYLDDEGTARCGLPAEVKCSYTMQSSDGPLDSVMIRCPAGHLFNGPIEFLTWNNGECPDVLADAGVAGTSIAAVLEVPSLRL